MINEKLNGKDDYTHSEERSDNCPASVQGNFFGESELSKRTQIINRSTRSIAPHQSPATSNAIRLDELPLLSIVEHPQVRCILEELAILSLWTTPDPFLRGDAFRRLARRSPFRIVQVAEQYQCFSGFLLLAATKQILSAHTRVPVLLHPEIDIATLTEFVIDEVVLEPIWHRQSSDELKRLTDTVIRLLPGPHLAVVLRPTTKSAVARMLKRSLSSISHDE